ncbi:MAG: NAD(P)H-binding protein [Kiritimatiellia bacterium]
MYVIVGATGHVGRLIAESLLEHGKAVGAMGRNSERLKALVKMGAQPMIGSLEDPAFVARSFSGAEAVFTMIPPQPYARDFRAFQTRVGTAIAASLVDSGVRYVVNLSSLGAHLNDRTGLIAGLHEQEERLNALSGLHVMHLRPAFFMENLLFNIDLIKANGINGTPLKGDLRFPVIAVEDVARAAAENLLFLTFKEISVRELLGQRDLTMREMTRILGKAIGQPTLQYVEFSYEETCSAMINAGISRDVARLYAEMYKAFNEGRVTSGLVRSDRNTTETPFEKFAKQFAALYVRGDGRPAVKEKELALQQ